MRNLNRVLIAEDDAVSRRLLEATLRKWGFEVVVCADGLEALEALQRTDAPQLAILDWMMPLLSGIDLCQRMRALNSTAPPYLILLTARGGKEDLLEAFRAGADDYVRKPFDQEELHARLRVGLRVIALRQHLAEHAAQADQESLRLRALLRIAEASHNAPNLGELLHSVHLELGGLIDTKNFYVALYDARREVYEFPYSIDEFDGTDFAPQELRHSFTDYVRRTGAPLLVTEDKRREMVVNGDVAIVGAPSKVWLGAPLRTRRGVIGVVAVQSYSDASAYSEKDLGLLTLVSGHVATAIERQQSYEALRESEDRYRDLVENSGLWVCTHDLQGKILSANRTAAAAMGFDRAEAVVGLRIQDVLHPEARKEFPAYLAALQREGRVHGLMKVRGGADGKSRILEFENSVRLEGEEGPIVRGMALDVTERKLAEKALRHSEERHRQLFHINPQPMWVFDRETLRFLEVNESAIQHYGYSRDEFLQMTIADIRPAEDVPALLKDIAENHVGLDKGGIWRHRLKNGKTVQVEITSHNLEFNGRNAELVLAQDVTERKRLEEQLIQAQKMEAVGRLAGGIAHDFNNLLAVIIGYGEVLHEDPLLKDAGRIRAGEILKAGNRAADLTKQLLAFSRKQVIEPRVIDVHALAGDVSRMLQRLIGEDIELDFRTTAADSRIKADPSQIEQVILNLAVNARDAMPDGGRLTVETSNVLVSGSNSDLPSELRPGPYLVVAVSDTGVGIGKEIQDHIFEPFFTTKESGRGTGLGLATVYGIVHQSGGAIQVDSELGKGSTFRLFFPCATGEAMPSTANPSRPQDGVETILLVEDSVSLREMICGVLTNRGYTVLAASNGQEAIELHKIELPVDLLVTDVVMPGMNGKVLANRLLEAQPDLSVLYISGYTADAIGRHGVLDPGVAFLQKPFQPRELTAKVREVLDARTGSPQAGQSPAAIVTFDDLDPAPGITQRSF